MVRGSSGGDLETNQSDNPYAAPKARARQQVQRNEPGEATDYFWMIWVFGVVLAALVVVPFLIIAVLGWRMI